MSMVSPVLRMSEALEALLVAEAKLRAQEQLFWRGFCWGWLAGGLAALLALAWVLFARGG